MSDMNDPRPSELHIVAPDSLSDEAWIALLLDDETAPNLLASVLTQAEPVPEWMFAGAATAWNTRDLDSELVELLSESSSAGVARGSSQTTLVETTEDLRLLTFGVRGAGTESPRIEISIRPDITGAVIDGTVLGARPTEVSWEDAFGNRATVEVDRFGRFEILPGTSTRARVRFSSPATEGRRELKLITPWFDLY
jgi:hypothetical protein